MDAVIHTNTSVSREFAVKQRARAKGKESVRVEIRLANVLNHTNVTELEKPPFGQATTADYGRRVEISYDCVFRRIMPLFHSGR